MADNSTIGSLYAIQRGLEESLVGLHNILQKQGIDRHQIPFRPTIVAMPIPTKTSKYSRWYPNDTHELRQLWRYGFELFNPTHPKPDIHNGNGLAILNNSEIRRNVTIDVPIPYYRVGKRGVDHHVRLTGPSIVDIFKNQNPMIPITPIQDRIIPLSYKDYVDNKGRMHPWREEYTYKDSLAFKGVTEGYQLEATHEHKSYWCVPDVMRVDFFIVEDTKTYMKTGNQIYPDYGATGNFGGLLVFPRFIFPMRYTTKDANNTTMYPRYGIKGSGDKLHPNVMDFYKFTGDTTLHSLTPLTLTSNIYLTKHDGQPPSDNAHIDIAEALVAKGWRYPDLPNGKVVYPNIIYSMMPAGIDYGTTKFSLYTSYKRNASSGSTVQSAYDVGNVDTQTTNISIPYPDLGVMKASMFQLMSPTLADFTGHQTLPDTATVPVGRMPYFIPDQNYNKEQVGANYGVLNSLTISSIRGTAVDTGQYDEITDYCGILNVWAYYLKDAAWPDWNYNTKIPISLNGLGEKIYQIFSRRGKHDWDSLCDESTYGIGTRNDNIPFTYYAIRAAGVHQWNSSSTIASTTDSEYQIYSDWNNYYGKVTPISTKREYWGNRLLNQNYSIRQSSHRAGIDHIPHMTFKWISNGNVTWQNPFFRLVCSFDGTQPAREELWYRNYVYAKTGREIYLALACTGQRLFISDASTPNAPTWREVDIPLLPEEGIRGICEYKGFFLFYTLFGYFFTTDFIDFEYVDVIPNDRMFQPEARRPETHQSLYMTNSANWYSAKMIPFECTPRTNGDQYYMIDNMKIVEGYIYASIKSNCLWTSADRTTDLAVNRTFHYQILRSKYPIFKQLYEYVTPYDVYMNHSFVDIYGKKKNGFKMNPEFLTGGARQHRLYTPASTDLQKSLDNLMKRKVYDNIIKCVEFKGELYALKFRFSLPNFYFEQPYVAGSVMAGPVHHLMGSIADADHLRAEARFEKILPGLAKEDGAEYSEPIWIMNREIAKTQISASVNAVWNDYLVWGLYDLSGFSNIFSSRALGFGVDCGGYAYKKGFLASPANGSMAMEVIDGKIVISFTAITNPYGIYSKTGYTPYSTSTGTGGWTPATANDMTLANKIMVLFDGQKVYQSDLTNGGIDNNWGLSYYLTKHPNWSTHRPDPVPTVKGILGGIGSSNRNGDVFYFLSGYRTPSSNSDVTAKGISYNLAGTTSAEIKTAARKITGTTDTSSETTLKYPGCPPPGFMMPTTMYRYGIIRSTDRMTDIFTAKASDYRSVIFHTEGFTLTRTLLPNAAADIVGDTVALTKYPIRKMLPIVQGIKSTYINLQFDCPQMEKPADCPTNLSPRYPIFNGFKVLNDRILALFGYIVADITTYNPPNLNYFKKSVTRSTDVTVNLVSAPSNIASVLDIFKPAFAESKALISEKRAMGQLWISPHDSIPVGKDGNTVWPTTQGYAGRADLCMVDYTIDVLYIDGRYYQFLPGSIFVHEQVDAWHYMIDPWDSRYGDTLDEVPAKVWTHKVLWTTPLVRCTEPATEDAIAGGTDAPLPTHNFWQINGRKPIYMNGYFFLPWCGLYVDLYGKTHSIPETSDFSPSEQCSRFVTNQKLGGGKDNAFALNQLGNRLGNEDPYYQIMDKIHAILPFTNYTDGAVPPVSPEMYAYYAMYNYSGWNQFYQCGNRLYAYTPSAIGSQISYIISKADKGVEVVNCVPYDVRPCTQEYLAMTEYTGHKPQFYHKKINLWDYQYQWETVNGITKLINRVIMQNKPYLMIDLPFHPTKVIVMSRDRKLVISEYREFEFDKMHGVFLGTSDPGSAISLPIHTQRTGSGFTWTDTNKKFVPGDKYSCNFMAHAIRYEFQPDGGAMDLNNLQTTQDNQIYPDENSWIDNNTVYIYNPKVGEKGPHVRQPVFDSSGRVYGQAGAYYDELPRFTPTNGYATDYGYRFNVIDIYAWC